MATTGPALWPGATTFPNTSVYPGQGTMPIVRCYLSTEDISVAELRVWTDVTPKMRAYATARGRQDELSDFDAGTATVVLDNRDRSFDPTIYPTIRPMNQLWLFEEFSGEVQALFKGYAEAWQQTWDQSGIVDAVATVTATTEWKILSRNVLPSTGTISTGNTQASSDAIGQILDLVSSQAPRNIQPGTRSFTTAIGGVTNLVFSLTGQSPSAALLAVVSVEAEDAAAFVAASGAITFLNSMNRSGAPYSTVQATFDDDGTDLPYLDLVSDYSDAFLFNRWTVTDTIAGDVTLSDSASIAANGQRQNSRSLGTANDIGGTRTAIATDLLTKYKDPMTRVTSIKPNMADAEAARVVFARELLDRIEVFRTPPGGGARFDQQLFIQKIEISGSPGLPPDCTLGVSPL